MANSFDQFPLYDQLVERQTNQMSPVWRDSMATFWQNLTDYISQNGIVPPSLTTAERDGLQNPANGQTIYNTTEDTAQYYKVSSQTWVSYP